MGQALTGVLGGAAVAHAWRRGALPFACRGHEERVRASKRALPPPPLTLSHFAPARPLSQPALLSVAHTLSPPSLLHGSPLLGGRRGACVSERGEPQRARATRSNPLPLPQLALELTAPPFLSLSPPSTARRPRGGRHPGRSPGGDPAGGPTGWCGARCRPRAGKEGREERKKRARAAARGGSGGAVSLFSPRPLTLFPRTAPPARRAGQPGGRRHPGRQRVRRED